MPGPKGKTSLLSCLPEEGLYFHLLPPPLPQGNSTKVPPPTYLSPEEEKSFFRGHGREGRWHSHSLLLGSTSRLDVPLGQAQSHTGYIFSAFSDLISICAVAYHSLGLSTDVIHKDIFL